MIFSWGKENKNAECLFWFCPAAKISVCDEHIGCRKPGLWSSHRREGERCPEAGQVKVDGEGKRGGKLRSRRTRVSSLVGKGLNPNLS